MSIDPRGLVLALLLLLAPRGLAQAIGEVPRVEPGPDAAVEEVLEWTSEQGQEYWYRLPKTSGRAEPNLVVMLHGTGLNHGWSFWNYGIGSGQFRGGDIVVSPDGLTPGGNDTFNFVQGRTDGEQIAGLIEHFRSRFEIGNVYLYGHSQGAFFCYWFAGEYPELIDGFCAHAGNVLDVKHPRLAKENIAVGILHGRSDQVVGVAAAERTHGIYEGQGYAKLKLTIVEGLRDQAGHWPLPVQVAEMFEWIDSVSIRSAPQAVLAATEALAKRPPLFAAAVRATAEAVELMSGSKGAEREQAEADLAAVLESLEAAAAAAWAVLQPEMEAADGGKLTGSYAADARWFRAAFGGLEGHRARAKPFAGLFKKHDKALAKLGKIKDKESKKYARALLDALNESHLGLGWGGVLEESRRRVAGGWAPVEELTPGLEALAGALPDPEESEVRAAAVGALDQG